MRQKIKLLLLTICVIFAAGCLASSNDSTESNKNDLVNPLNKDIEPFIPTFPVSAFQDSDLIMYKPWTNYSSIGYSNESLISESDIVFYGKLADIGSSYWSTADQKPPSGLNSTQVGRCIYGFEGTQVVHSCVSIQSGEDYIYTPVIFEVNNLVKGDNLTTITVIISGGQAENYIMDGCYATVWDLQEGQNYLVYLKKCDDGTYKIMDSGLFVVLN